MASISEKIKVMCELLLCSHGLHYWHLDADLKPISSNCPNQEFFYDLFCLSRNEDLIREHFSKAEHPVIVSDWLGVVWIAGTASNEYHLLGPFFSMEASEANIRQMCRRLKLSDNLANELLTQLKHVPVIHLSASFRYGIMLQCCLTGEHLTANDIVLHIQADNAPPELNWGGTAWHGTWEAERELFESIKSGNVSNIAALGAKFASGNIGTMSHGDPLRQTKNEGIVFATLCSRAAILGGVSPEGGYNLSDYYILRIEAADTVTAAQITINEMTNAFLRRVQQAKESSKYSSVVSACMEYIETHITEKIGLEAMAKELGYSNYYLSSKFQKETGNSINSYISQRKVEEAKRMLGSQALTAADVSEALSFSSPSYFAATFRKFTGMSPSAWQHQKHNA